MIKNQKIINYLNELFPKKLAFEWDNVGEQIQNSETSENVLVCLDVTFDVVNFAIANNVQLIISRHPLIFTDYQQEIKIDYKKKIIDLLNEHKISLFSIHTNYDNSPNNGLINLLKTNFDICDLKISNQYFDVKLNKQINLEETVKIIENIFNINKFNFSLNFNFDKMVDHFYLCSGAGAEGMVENNLKDCPYVTGEVKWHHWIYANSCNVDLIAIGHYMENYFCDDLKDKLKAQFKELNVLTFDISNQYK